MSRRWWMAVLLATLVLATRVVASFPTSRHVRRHRQLVTEEDFMDQCTASLLSDAVVADDLISQDEFTQLLSEYCVQQQVCEESMSLDFTNLSVELQLAFVLFICNEPTEVERKRCLQELVADGEPFGYNVQEEEERDILDTELQELCSLTYLYASRSGLLPATTAPTQAPTSPPIANVGENDSSAGGGGAGDGDGTTGETNDDNDPNSSSGSAGPPISSRNNILSNGAIVGVALAGVVVVLVAAFLVSRRRNKRRVKEQDKYVQAMGIAGDESIYTEDSAAFKYIPKGMGSFHSAHSVASSSAKSSKRSSLSGSSGGVGGLPLDVTTGIKLRSVAQFDPGNSAAAIALDIDGSIIRRDSTTSSNKSIPMMSLDEGKHETMKSLTSAIEHGDWDTVARLAGSLASSEEVSTISEYSSAREQLSSKSSRNSDDSVLAAQIEEMVQRGDWSGVAAAAQHFSSSRSQQSGTRSGGVRSNTDTPKRSFLNFVTGRRSTQSAAATAAIVPNAPDAVVERDSDMSEAGLAHVGEAEDIPSVLETAALNDTMDTQSSSSHGSRQEETDRSQKPKKRWLGRLISARGSKKESSSHVGASENRQVQSSAHSSESALKADLSEALSRGDWGKIEEISAKLDELGTRNVSSGPRTTRESNENDLKTLGAMSLSAMKNSPKRPGVVSSIASQRAEIDEAVKRGDWEAVETLTTQFLNTKPPAKQKDAMTDTLMLETPSPSNKSPSALSPFRDTPTSSEWSLSPVDKEERSRKLRKLIEAQDWKGVNVLSGIYEMEAKGALPPSFASLSNDSADNTLDFASGWLFGGNSNTPPDSVEGSPRRPPPSPSTSTSTNNSNEIREFERLVNAKDWKGLAAFAGAEDDIDHDDSQLLPRHLFDIDSLIPEKQTSKQSDSEEGGLEHVELRETGGPKFRDFKNEDSDAESIHGAQKLIPHWEHKIEDNSPDKSSKRKDTRDQKK